MPLSWPPPTSRPCTSRPDTIRVSLQGSNRSLLLGGAAVVVGCGDVSRMGGAVLVLGGALTDSLTVASCAYTPPPAAVQALALAHAASIVIVAVATSVSAPLAARAADDVTIAAALTVAGAVSLAASECRWTTHAPAAGRGARRRLAMVHL